MSDSFTEIVKKKLPLKIENVVWDGNSFTISGKEWNFSTSSAWRLLVEEKIQLACWDSSAEQIVGCIINQDIIGIDYQSTRIKVDPIFELSNNTILEIFATDTFEPWVFSSSEQETIVGSFRA